MLSQSVNFNTTCPTRLQFGFPSSVVVNQRDAFTASSSSTRVDISSQANTLFLNSHSDEIISTSPSEFDSYKSLAMVAGSTFLAVGLSMWLKHKVSETPPVVSAVRQEISQPATASALPATISILIDNLASPAGAQSTMPTTEIEDEVPYYASYYAQTYKGISVMNSYIPC